MHNECMGLYGNLTYTLSLSLNFSDFHHDHVYKTPPIQIVLNT